MQCYKRVHKVKVINTFLLGHLAEIDNDSYCHHSITSILFFKKKVIKMNGTIKLNLPDL